MAVNRCFDTFTPKQNSSDYRDVRRQKTLFNEVNNNIIKLNNANPQKKNGFSYNSNFGVRSANKGTGAKGCLAFANNYELLLDITKGKTIIDNQSINCEVVNPFEKMNAPVFDSWSGNLYSVNYNEHDVGVIANVDTKNCVLTVDPEHKLFYDACPLSELSGYPPQWFGVVDISFNDTTYYTEANRTQIMNGFNYPELVTFGS